MPHSDLGFDPYVAVEEQTLRGLTDNIFGQLRKSEYFVFVDFKREQLIGTQLHRGSLSAHQELAIASFLNIEGVVALQEAGVKTDDGMLRFLHGNATFFSDRHTLPNVIADLVSQRRWDANWGGELVLQRDAAQYSEVPTIFAVNEPPQMSRHFHITVRNHQRERMATNCNVYLEKLVRLPDEIIPIRTIEFKWAGVQFPNVAIAAQSERAFDAFWIQRRLPIEVHFNTFTDSSDFYPRFPRKTGAYELTYLVTSENFASARAIFRLELQPELDRTMFCSV
jgi:hypothetical protein